MREAEEEVERPEHFVCVMVRARVCVVGVDAASGAGEERTHTM